jgi:hypothetical protein
MYLEKSGIKIEEVMNELIKRKNKDLKWVMMKAISLQKF